MRLILRLSAGATRFWVPFMLAVYAVICFLVGWEAAGYRHHPIDKQAVVELFNPRTIDGEKETKPKVRKHHRTRKERLK